MTLGNQPLPAPSPGPPPPPYPGPPPGYGPYGRPAPGSAPYGPMPPSGWAQPVVAPARRRGPRTWVILLLVGAVFTVLAVGAAAFLVGVNSALTHELVQADFQNEATPFHVGTQSGVEYALLDGWYSIRQTDSSPHIDVSLGEYSRVAYVAHATADVRVPAGSPAPIAVGIGCYNQRQQPDGYVLLAAPDGSQAAIVRRDAGTAGPTLATFTASEGMAEAVTSLRLDCATQGPSSSGMNLTGYVNGRPVLTASDANGIGEFAYTALVMSADQVGAEVRFDNVVTKVPE